MSRFFIYYALIFISIFSCSEEDPVIPKSDSILPEVPLNLENFNTEFDDYNSTAPTIGNIIAFCFSTNRNSHGEQFDVLFEPMEIIFERSTKEFNVSNEPLVFSNLQKFQAIEYGLNKINETSSNELGPYAYQNFSNTFYGFETLLLYATDASGNFDINFTFNDPNNNLNFSEPKSLDFLNSEFDDLYPSFDFNSSRMFFCSNRNGISFNIYEVAIDIKNNQLLNELSSENDHEIAVSEVLSSDFDDKCPFFYENMMVFSSNRPGGSGGFDLYYSKNENGVWSPPVNFGPKINTTFDEYRPILFEENIDYQKHTMVFSSNRSGGKGGFDLYMVAIDKDL